MDMDRLGVGTELMLVVAEQGLTCLSHTCMRISSLQKSVTHLADGWLCSPAAPLSVHVTFKGGLCTPLDRC